MDANATTPLLPEVVEAMRPYWMERFGNASSIHQDGQQARHAIESARETLAEFLGCREAEVVFNSGGTEGDNTALFGMLSQGDHLITTSIEHSAILQTAQRLEKFGVEVTYIAPQPCGLIDPESIRAALRPNTRLISVMLANNETGVVQPVAEIGKIAHAIGAFFHIDAVQGAGKMALDVRTLGCHLLSISAHKMHGPKGVGALFVRRGTPLESLLVGGSHEHRRRAGTENVAGIVGLGKAAELAMHSLEDGTFVRVAGLRDRLEAGILKIPGTGVNGVAPQFAPEGRRENSPGQAQRSPGKAAKMDLAPRRGAVNALVEHGFGAWDGVGAPGPDFRTGESPRPVPRVANTTNLWFDHLESEALVIALDLKGIAVSGGSACASGATHPSHVLLAMGVSKARARASLRLSLLKTASEAEVDRVLEVLPEAVAKLRAISPVEAGTAG
jgi:cysteine desulfurase